MADAVDIDVLVNNADFEVQGALEKIDDELMHRRLDINPLPRLGTVGMMAAASIR